MKAAKDVGSCRGLFAELDGLGGARDGLSGEAFGRGELGITGLRWPISLRIVASRSRCLSSADWEWLISDAGDATLENLLAASALRHEVNLRVTITLSKRLT